MVPKRELRGNLLLEKLANVKVARELLPLADKLVKTAKNDFGMPVYRSRSDVVTKALAEFLRNHLPAKVEVVPAQ